MPSQDPASYIARTALIVLGMHRSGTSALSGLLHSCGYALPQNLATADKNNQKGYFESREFWGINDDIFAELGTRWDDWNTAPIDTLNADRRSHYRNRMQTVLQQEFTDAASHVLIKDPRMCRLLPLWLDALQELGWSVNIVLTCRHPNEVASSLQRRDGLSPGFSFLMWLHYVLEAERSSRGLTRCFSSYDQVMAMGLTLIPEIHKRLQLPPPALAETSTSAADFISNDLRHFSDHSASLPPLWWHDCFTIMKQWADHGEDPSDHRRLDEIREAINTLPAPLMAALGSDALPTLAEDGKNQRSLSAELQELQRDNSQLEQTLSEERQARNALTMELQAAQLDSEQLRRKLAEATQVYHDQQAQMQGVQHDNRQLEKTLASVRQAQRTLDMTLQSTQQEKEDLEGILEIAKQHQEHNRLRLNRAEHAVITMQQSTSWRLTGPARALAKLLKTLYPR